MSMALDTTLAINYLLVNVRTWLAFLTTTLSFWKIKWSPSPPPPPHDHHHHHQRLPAPPAPPPRQTPAEVLTSGGRAYCRLENRRSGKFRVVYHGEDDKEAAATANTNTNSNTTCTTMRVKGERRRSDIDIAIAEGWEGLLKLKTADMGWYRHQDLSLLDGNVVQLWHAPYHFNHHLQHS